MRERERGGDDMQQRAKGRILTLGRCRGDTASVHGAHALPLLLVFVIYNCALNLFWFKTTAV